MGYGKVQSRFFIIGVLSQRLFECIPCFLPFPVRQIHESKFVKGCRWRVGSREFVKCTIIIPQTCQRLCEIVTSLDKSRVKRNRFL